jgi:glutamine synthetase
MASEVDEGFLKSGWMFDGSSIAGWKSINESDMKLMPDLDSGYLDPFYSEKTFCLHCNVVEPESGKLYGRDPRSTAVKAEEYLKKTKIGTKAFFGPEAEFFLFDDVKFSNSMNKVSFEVDAMDASWNTDTSYEMGNMGHRPGVKGGYFPVNPTDAGQDIRSEMLSTMKRMGMKVDKHHHEVASCQHELGLVFDSLKAQGDNLQKYKYVIQNVAHSYGKSATFMPKPIANDNGTGMHTNMSIWDGNSPVFAGKEYAGLSKNALHYIGGILKHAKALNAFTNPSTNSYKRLIPGFEAPVLLAFSAKNRSASIRIPYVESSKATRVEARFPDPTANPYLSFAALLMAGLDGIKNKIDPGEAATKDLYDLPPDELASIPTVCGSLREALNSLENDHEFLLQGDVFNVDQLEGYMDLKWEEVYAVEHTPHPVEYGLYYSL